MASFRFLILGTVWATAARLLNRFGYERVV